MTELWTTILKIALKILEDVDQKKISADAEYTRLATHLDYLDDKILKFLSLYIQIAIAIIGGAFFLSANKEGLDPTWAIKVNALMVMVSAGAVLFILHHLSAWKRYREELTDKFPQSKAPGPLWYMSETTMCLFIAVTCGAFCLINPLNSGANDQIMTGLILVAIIVTIVCVGRQFQSHSIKTPLVLLLIGLMLALPNQAYIKSQLKDWNGILKFKVLNSNIKAQWGDKALSLTIPDDPQKIDPSDAAIDSAAVFDAPKNKAIEIPENLIKNGSFNIDLTDAASGWGAGLYTSQLGNIVPNSKIVWVNFLSADIDAQVVSSEAGNALKIINRTGNIPNRVGLMEQIINVSPGMYELSFSAKGEKLEPNSLQITTTPDWTTLDPKDQSVSRGIELVEGGSFGWKKIEAKIKIDEKGPITFSVISKNKGTLYITDLVLRRVSE